MTTISSSAADSRRWWPAGDFLEWADVFGNLYGTGGVETQRVLDAGHDLVLVIDVQGARQVRQCGFGHVGIFVLPPSFEVLEARLRSRSKDTEAPMQRRLAVARQEVDAVEEYDYVVINDEVEPAVSRLARDCRRRAGATAVDAGHGRCHHPQLPRQGGLVTLLQRLVLVLVLPNSEPAGPRALGR